MNNKKLTTIIQGVRIGFACAMAVAFIIALPTFLCGCDNIIQPNCIRYYVLNVTIVGYKVNQKLCSTCVAWDRVCTRSYKHNDPRDCTETCDDECIFWRHYDCYDSYAIGKFDKNGHRTCNIRVDTDNINQNNALNDAKIKYMNGTGYTMYVEKNTYDCFTETNVRTLARVGFAFFIIMGLILVTWIIIEIIHYVRQRGTNQISRHLNISHIHNGSSKV